MKKTTIYFAAAMGAFLLLSGCAAIRSEDPGAASSDAREEPIAFSETQLYAVAGVGYDDLTELPFYLERYLDGESVPIHYLSGGEYYLIIPRYEDMDLKLYKNDMVTERSDLVFEEKSCKPFLIQCNISDIFADATISLTYREETVEFTPYVSLQDGSYLIGDRGLDITK